VALNAALGSAMIRNQPAATAVHVDVGTLNYGGAIHTAWRGNYPVLITAGTGPRAYPGSMAGARNSAVQWCKSRANQGAPFYVNTLKSIIAWSTRTIPVSWSAVCYKWR